MKRPSFSTGSEDPAAVSGISPSFPGLSQTQGQVAHVLLTRAPLYSPLRAFSLDLHVLGTPPAFVLSQDQTLQLRVAKIYSEIGAILFVRETCCILGKNSPSPHT